MSINEAHATLLSFPFALAFGKVELMSPDVNASGLKEEPRAKWGGDTYVQTKDLGIIEGYLHLNSGLGRIEGPWVRIKV